MKLLLEIDSEDCFTIEELDFLIEVLDNQYEIARQIETFKDEELENALIATPIAGAMYKAAKEEAENPNATESKRRVFKQMREHLLNKMRQRLEGKAPERLKKNKMWTTKLHLLKHAILNAEGINGE